MTMKVSTFQNVPRSIITGYTDTAIIFSMFNSVIEYSSDMSGFDLFPDCLNELFATVSIPSVNTVDATNVSVSFVSAITNAVT